VDQFLVDSDQVERFNALARQFLGIVAASAGQNGAVERPLWSLGGTRVDIKNPRWPTTVAARTAVRIRAIFKGEVSPLLVQSNARISPAACTNTHRSPFNLLSCSPQVSRGPFPPFQALARPRNGTVVSTGKYLVSPAIWWLLGVSHSHTTNPVFHLLRPHQADITRGPISAFQALPSPLNCTAALEATWVVQISILVVVGG
jgi:hypothetical protein